MKPRNSTILVMLLGLLLVAFAAGIAQTPAQGDQKKKAESCCAMESGCCNGDSCPMKAEGTKTAADAPSTDAASADAKKDHSCCGDSCEMKDGEGMKTDSGDHSCCGDSCDMNMKHDANMKHDPKMKHDKKHDCCNMKQKDKTKKAA